MLAADSPAIGSPDDPVTRADLDLHLVCDNYATHKTQAIRKWLLRHPRFRLHFTPTSSSWLNLVPHTGSPSSPDRKLRRSAHRSVTELEADIRKWINEGPALIRTVTNTALKLIKVPAGDDLGSAMAITPAPGPRWLRFGSARTRLRSWPGRMTAPAAGCRLGHSGAVVGG